MATDADYKEAIRKIREGESDEIEIGSMCFPAHVCVSEESPPTVERDVGGGSGRRLKLYLSRSHVLPSSRCYLRRPFK